MPHPTDPHPFATPPGPATTRRLLPWLPAVLALLLTVAAAQPIGREFTQGDRLRLAGDSLRFCVVEDLLISDYHRELAHEIAGALLLSATIVNVTPPRPNEPLDYRTTLNEAQIFYLLANDCEIYMGLTLSTSTSRWDWLITSRPYLATRTVFVTTNPDYRSLADIPVGEPLGTRILTNGDIRLLSYLQTLPEERRWRRFPYYNNLVALEQLLAGEVTASLVWEPAAVHFQLANPQPELHRLPPDPVPLANTELVLALRSQDSFIQSALDTAIVALADAGILDALAAAHGLPNVPVGTAR